MLHDSNPIGELLKEWEDIGFEQEELVRLCYEHNGRGALHPRWFVLSQRTALLKAMSAGNHCSATDAIQPENCLFEEARTTSQVR